ncbi:MAG: chromosome partitioning protein ParB, partial [Alphaproteobacteria bacterium]|nr:chromosome partitioning protein ParB [Alphaproteobacteria bacterium]
EIADKIVSKGLTVRQTEDLVNSIKNKALQKIAKAVKKDPSIKELEKDLTKSIGLKVRINAGQNNSGKISIEYNNPAELNSILERLDNK